jgi:NAD(P)-dependent dehydrogenase (short-subunit alcohol dehydrogenase family)
MASHSSTEGDNHVKLQDCAARLRFTHAGDFARTVMCMTSENSRRITGHGLIIDGGWDV